MKDQWIWPLSAMRIGALLFLSFRSLALQELVCFFQDKTFIKSLHQHLSMEGFPRYEKND